MSLRWHSHWCVVICFVAAASIRCAEEPASGYVPDPTIEKIINDALDTDKAVAFPAQKRLGELGGASERALNFKLFSETVTQKRRAYAELIARCCAGRVGYRVTLELLPDGSGKLILESDRTLLAECAQKFDRLNGEAPRVFTDEVMRRNPYSKVEIAKHFAGSLKYNQGGTLENGGRFIANGEVAFSTFDDFAAFATSFDKFGYHMLNGISMFDNGNLRTVRFKKNAEADRNRAINFLLSFHDVKWEFVLDYKGELKNQNSSRVEAGKYIWRFNCAEMVNGEAEIDASFDPREMFKQNAPVAQPRDPATANAAPVPGAPVALLASKVVRVAVGKRFDPDTSANPNGPDTIATLDGSPSQPANNVSYQWMQTSGLTLNLPKEKLSQPIIKMRFYEVGRYTFQLIVSHEGASSPPAEVTVLVGDVTDVAGGAVPPASTDSQGDDSASIHGKTELQPSKNLPIAKGDLRPPVDKGTSNTFKATPAPAPLARRDPTPVAAPSGAIALEEIRREEAEYCQRSGRSSGGSSGAKLNTAQNTSATAGNNSATQPSPIQASPVQPPVQQNAIQPTAAPAQPGPAVIAAQPEKGLDRQGTEVAMSGRIELDEIRKVEKTLTRARPVSNPPLAAQPIVPPVEKAAPPIKETPLPIAPDKVVTAPEPPKIDTQLEPIKPLPKKIAAPKPIDSARVDSPKEVSKASAAPTATTPEIEKLKVPEKEAVIAPPAPPMASSKKIEPTDVTPKVANVAPQPAPIVTIKGGDPLQNSQQLMKIGRYAQAVELLKPLAQVNAKDIPIQMALGAAMFEAAEKPDGYDRAGVQAALDKFIEVLSLDEGNAQAYMYAGHCNGRLERDQDKMMCYKKGFSIGKDKVAWEIKWHLGNTYLKSKDYASAASVLAIAEESAIPAGVKNPRLLRDLAVAFHGANKDDEAIRRVNALWELGYLPDQNLVAELKKGSPDAVKVPESAYAQSAPNVAASPLINTTAAALQKIDTTDGAKPSTPQKPIDTAPARVENVAKPAENPTAQITPQVPTPAVAAVNTGPQSTDLKPPESEKKQVTVKNLDDLTTKSIATHPRPAAPVRSEAPAVAQRVTKPLPPVPTSFEAALAAGKNALARGKALIERNPEAARNEALDCWDEAEAMLRGAWDMTPGDADVAAQFEELAKQVGVIALVKSHCLISRPNGYVVLNAEATIAYPKEKPLYYAWEQVDGKELGIRHEEMNKKMVGLRIKNPGTYKFELVVSDGTHGGNPVTVTVEVR